jgi:hypothetical protein
MALSLHSSDQLGSMSVRASQDLQRLCIDSDGSSSSVQCTRTISIRGIDTLLNTKESTACALQLMQGGMSKLMSHNVL